MSIKSFTNTAHSWFNTKHHSCAHAAESNQIFDVLFFPIRLFVNPIRVEVLHSSCPHWCPCKLRTAAVAAEQWNNENKFRACVGLSVSLARAGISRRHPDEYVRASFLNSNIEEHEANKRRKLTASVTSSRSIDHRPIVVTRVVANSEYSESTQNVLLC